MALKAKAIVVTKNSGKVYVSGLLCCTCASKHCKEVADGFIDILNHDDLLPELKTQDDFCATCSVELKNGNVGIVPVQTQRD